MVNKTKKTKVKKKIVKDKDGWVKFPDFYPPKFELCIVQDELGIEQIAWWIGYRWDWGNKRIKSTIVKWKKLPRAYDFIDQM